MSRKNGNKANKSVKRQTWRLDVAQIAEIKKLYKNGKGMRQRQIADKFHVGQGTISRIVNL